MYTRPPHTRNPDGDDRRIGVEIEYAGVTIERSAELVQSLYGGSISQSDPFGATVTDTEFGEFRIEVDATPLQNRRFEQFLASVGVDLDALDIKSDVEQLLSSVASVFVPTEIAAPPISWRNVHALEQLRERLCDEQAEDTRKAFWYAFGLQLNVEVASVEADYLRRHLQAFLSLQDALRAQCQVDVARRIAPFIRAFPQSYKDLLMRPHYQPDLETLIDDYLEHNPTRNRSLDMMPLFAYLDVHRVKAGCKQAELVKPRPTFHYRLPDSVVSDSEWRIAHEWDRWLQVERLADDRDRLAAALQG